MAEFGTLARPYAKAAFEYALSKGALGAWLEQLALASDIAKTPAMQAVLANPSFTARQKAALFNDVCAQRVSGEFKNLVSALAENTRLALFPAILEQFNSLKEEHEKTVEVEIRTAFPLTAEVEQSLAQALQQKLAREVKTQTILDPSLIGGVFIRAGDLVIDGSAKGRLVKLAETMSS